MLIMIVDDVLSRHQPTGVQPIPRFQAAFEQLVRRQVAKLQALDGAEIMLS